MASSRTARALARASVGVLLAGGLAACRDDDEGAARAAESSPAATADAGANGISKSAVDVGVAFTGGKAGKADPPLAPVTIGFVNQSGGTPAAKGQSELIDQGYVYKSFGDILAIAKFANAIGPDDVTPEAFEEQITAWRGPAFMVSGTYRCGKHPTYAGICGDSAGVSGFVDGAWKSIETVRDQSAA